MTSSSIITLGELTLSRMTLVLKKASSPKESVADRIKRFKQTALTLSPKRSESPFPFKPETVNDQENVPYHSYNSVEDILSLLRNKAIEEKRSVSSDSFTSVLQHVRNRSLDILSIPTREDASWSSSVDNGSSETVFVEERVAERTEEAVEVVPRQNVISELISRLTRSCSDDAEEDPMNVIKRIREKFVPMELVRVEEEAPPEVRQLAVVRSDVIVVHADATYCRPLSVRTECRIIIDQPRVVSVGTASIENAHAFSLVKFDTLSLISPVTRPPLVSRVTCLPLEPDWEDFIRSQISAVRSELFFSSQSTL